ncbi:MAG TPA: lysophospholipid acyltransferase family protein [Noviherbaspirillum sp.]|jgi:1-acyl-sn-glycerol-3-phosphate acyltransferase|uniref:lysophospholipid acyltransferase family protein n=1 Tax=Noviherbaspirillum sp. TaxID=1926288 RepID=UPI002F9411CE
MPALRMARLAMHLLRGLATCALLFPLNDRAGRDAHVRRWSARLLALCGVTVRIEHAQGAQPAGRALIVSNHVSWLDIFVINSLHPCRFVAKSDIRGWPLIGWLCARVGTIFIARGRLRDVRRIYQGLVESLKRGEHVAFFPEGTTAAQGTLLPFHANLFEAAIEAQVPVQPYALRYLDTAGRLHPAANFIGDMGFVDSVRMVLASGGMQARLCVLPAIALPGEPHRRDLADAARQAIAAALETDAAAPAQIDPGR